MGKLWKQVHFSLPPLFTVRLLILFSSGKNVWPFKPCCVISSTFLILFFFFYHSFLLRICVKPTATQRHVWPRCLKISSQVLCASKIKTQLSMYWRIHESQGSSCYQVKSEYSKKDPSMGEICIPLVDNSWQNDSSRWNRWPVSCGLL